MNLKRKRKINKSTQSLSYQEIRKRRFLDVRPKAEAVNVEKAKIEFFDTKPRPENHFKKLFSQWKLVRMRKRFLRKEAGLSRFHLDEEKKIQGETLKKWLKWFWGLKGMNKKLILKKSFALITILAVIVTAYFQNTPYASAATFTL